jgi:7-dehydrocholesterol reductase
VYINKPDAVALEMTLKNTPLPANPFWGRKKSVSQIAGLKSAIALLLAPSCVLFLSASLHFFDGSIFESFKEVWSLSLKHFISQYFPTPCVETAFAYGTWISFQALLYTVLPSKVCDGQPTPGGHTLKYNINGLLSFFVTILVSVWAGIYMIDPAWIARRWHGLLIAANLYGVLLSFIMYAKACLAPSKLRDTRFSGECYSHAYL